MASSNNAYNYEKFSLLPDSNNPDCAKVLGQMGVFGKSATRPNGAVEPVAILDDAIRQIKSYLLDDVNGPCAHTTRVDDDLQALKAIAVTDDEFLDNSILVANEAEKPIALQFDPFTILTRNADDPFVAQVVGENSIVARSGSGSILPIALTNANAILARAGADLVEFPLTALNAVMIRDAGDLKQQPIGECEILGRSKAGVLKNMTMVEIATCIKDDANAKKLLALLDPIMRVSGMANKATDVTISKAADQVWGLIELDILFPVQESSSFTYESLTVSGGIEQEHSNYKKGVVYPMSLIDAQQGEDIHYIEHSIKILLTDPTVANLVLTVVYSGGIVREDLSTIRATGFITAA